MEENMICLTELTHSNIMRIHVLCTLVETIPEITGNQRNSVENLWNLV